MKELHKILSGNVAYDKGINVTVDSGISEATIRIAQSMTMTLYGIGKQNELGFTLYISIDNRSTRGKKIINELTKDDILKEFKTFAENRLTMYVFDYNTDIDLIVNKTYALANRLKIFSPGNEIKLIVNRVNDIHTLE